MSDEATAGVVRAHKFPLTEMILALGRSLTVLDCQLGNHTGHFPITKVELFGRKLWGCDPCIEAKGAHR